MKSTMNLRNRGSVFIGFSGIFWLCFCVISSEGRFLTTWTEGSDDRYFGSKTLPTDHVEGVAIKNKHTFQEGDVSNLKPDDMDGSNEVYPGEQFIADVFHGIGTLASSFLSSIGVENPGRETAKDTSPQLAIPDDETDWKIQIRNHAVYNPYHVSIQDENGRHICSGAILKTNRVVTAAHCFTRNSIPFKPRDSYRVVAGVSNLNTPTTSFPPQTMWIKMVIPYPQYNWDISNEHDLAVLVLNGTYEFNDSLNFVKQTPKLFQNYKENGRRATVSGWIEKHHGLYRLNRGIVPILGNDRCAQILPPGVNPAKFLCTDQLEGSGESEYGRPIIFKQGNRDQTEGRLIGISSSTIGSTLISTRISEYVLWLAEQ